MKKLIEAVAKLVHPIKPPFLSHFSRQRLAYLFKYGLGVAARASMLALKTGSKIIDFLGHSSFATTSICCIAIIFFGSLQANPKMVAKFGQESCPWSAQLKKEIWDSSTFQVLLEAAGIDREVGSGKGEEALPVFVLLSSSGEEIGRIGFLLVPPEKYIDLAREMLSIHTLCQSLADLDASALLHLYRKAQVLQMAACEKNILQEGLKKDQGVDFLIAQYASIIEKHPRKARSIKKEIRARKLNYAGVEWELALISFQARKEQFTDQAKIVLPIRKFLRKFGKENPDYAWKSHFILAEFYRSCQEIEKMEFHLRESVQSAPAEFKKILESS